MPGIGIILVVFNQKHNLDLLYPSLAHQTINSIIIYFVDNNPEDGAIEYSKRINSNFNLNIKYLPQTRNTGFAGGNNIGARKAILEGCSHILILNNDIELDDNFLQEMLVQFSREDVGAVGPLILLGKKESKNSIIQEFGAKLNLRFYFINKYFSGVPYNKSISRLPLSSEVNFISGCAMMIKKEVYDKIGLWDERYFAYGDEIDFSKRISDTDFKLIVTRNAIIWHNHDWSKENKRGFYFEYYMIQRNKYLYLKKHKYYSGLMFNLLRDFFFLPLTYAWFMKVCDSRLLSFYIKGTFDGLLNRMGNPNLTYD